MVEQRVTVVMEPLARPAPDEGRVVSETVLRTPTVRVVEIALGPAGELREHSAPVPIIVQALEGIVDVDIADTTYRLEAPAFIYIPTPGERHRVAALEHPARIQITMLFNDASRHDA